MSSQIFRSASKARFLLSASEAKPLLSYGRAVATALKRNEWCNLILRER